MRISTIAALFTALGAGTAAAAAIGAGELSSSDVGGAQSSPSFSEPRDAVPRDLTARDGDDSMCGKKCNPANGDADCAHDPVCTKCLRHKSGFFGFACARPNGGWHP